MINNYYSHYCEQKSDINEHMPTLYQYASECKHITEMGVRSDNIDFLVGYVNDTLPKADIQQLSLLRIDVDAYSATMEVLEHLYDKVVTNGYIIFDDTCLIETRHAINDFFTARGIDIKLRHPATDQIIKFELNNMPCGCYMIKE